MITGAVRMAHPRVGADDGTDLVRDGLGTAGRVTMSDTSQEPDAGAVEEGGYGYPTLEQEVTPEVLAAGAEPDGTESAEDSSDGDGTPAVEPTD